MLEQGLLSERDMAAVVARSRRNAMDNPLAQLAGAFTVEELLAEEAFVAPLRRADCCPVSDGAAAMVIATVEQAQAWGAPYVRITGIDHRIENHNPCLRDLTDSVSTRQAAAAAGVHRGPVDVAEIYAPFSHQEILLTRALGLGDDTVVNPGGGVLAGNLMMASGLARVGEVFRRIINGEAGRGGGTCPPVAPACNTTWSLYWRARNG